MRRRIVTRAIPGLSLAAAVLTFPWVLPGAALGAIQLGQVSPAVNPTACGEGHFLQADAATAPYEVPSPGGVITSWSHRGRSGSGGSGRLHIWREAPGVFSFTLVGASVVEDFNAAGLVDSFLTRLPVSTGDKLGLRAAEMGAVGCIYGGMSGDDVYANLGGEPSFGGETSFGIIAGDNLVNVSAVLEPDADGDGFGDESQDGCPGQSGPDDGCPSPSSPPPGGGGPGEPVVPPAPPDLTLDAKNKQKPNKLQVDVACGEVDCSVDFAGKGKVPKASGAAVAAAKAKKFKLKPKSVEVAAGTTETVRLKFKRNRKAVEKIKSLLKSGGKKARKRAKAVVKATATSAGGADTAKQKVKLKG